MGCDRFLVVRFWSGFCGVLVLGDCFELMFFFLGEDICLNFGILYLEFRFRMKVI